MSAPLETVAAAPIRVMAAGGPAKMEAVQGAVRLLKPTTLVTDETTARTLVAAGLGARRPLAAGAEELDQQPRHLGARLEMGQMADAGEAMKRDQHV